MLLFQDHLQGYNTTEDEALVSSIAAVVRDVETWANLPGGHDDGGPSAVSEERRKEEREAAAAAKRAPVEEDSFQQMVWSPDNSPILPRRAAVNGSSGQQGSAGSVSPACTILSTTQVVCCFVLASC